MYITLESKIQSYALRHQTDALSPHELEQIVYDYLVKVVRNDDPRKRQWIDEKIVKKLKAAGFYINPRTGNLQHDPEMMQSYYDLYETNMGQVDGLRAENERLHSEVKQASLNYCKLLKRYWLFERIRNIFKKTRRK